MPHRPQIIFATSGEVVRIPGLPPMYDYEHQPQGVSKLEAYAQFKQLIFVQIPAHGMLGRLFVDARG